MLRPFMCLVLLGSVANSASAQTPPMPREGNWEISVSMEMPGLPVSPQPFVTTHCHSKEDLKDMEKMLPKNPMQNTCKMVNSSVSGNTYTYTMECTTERGKISGQGSLSYLVDSYQGKTTMEMPGPNGPMKISTQFRGKRLGDCKK